MNRFCSECGGLINQTIGECTNCHKKAFMPDIVNTDKSIKKPDLKKILLIVGLAVLLIVAGIFVFKLFGSNKKKNDIDYRERIDTGYNANGEQMYVSTRKYDNNGNMTSYEFEADDYYFAYKYKLDDNGYLVKMTQYDKKDSEPSQVNTYENEYDRKKNRISMQRYLNDKYDGYTTYEYDKEGNIIRSEVYDSDDKLSYYDIYEYDKRGNRILNEYHQAERDDTMSRTIWEYDDKDNVILEEYYDGDKLEYTMEYENEYDKKGNLIRCDYYRDGELDQSYEYEYDKKGRIIFEQHYDSKGEKGLYKEIEYKD